MYAYLTSFASGLDAPARERALRLAAREMPRFRHPVTFLFRHLPELDGGWGVILPATPEPRPLIQERAEEDVALLFYGELFGPGADDPCGHLLRLWRHHGDPAPLLGLNGNFVAFLADRRQRRLHVLGDLLGRRLPRLLETPRGLIAASQDLLLVASGRCSGEWDQDTAAALVAMDWPQGGRSLLRGVAAMPPHTRLTLEGDTLRRHPVPLVLERVAPQPEPLRAQVEAMLASLREHMAGLFAGQGHVGVDLTGGVDSRVVCALTRSLRSPESFHVECSGGSNSPEVSIAREICRREKLEFRAIDLGEQFPAPEAFTETLDALAFFLDGAGDARFAIRDFQESRGGGGVHLHGTGGELFRGRYYLKAGVETVSGRSADGLTEHLRAILVRAQADTLLTPEAHQEITRRLRSAMEHWCCQTRHAADALDLFFLFDRTLFWAIGDARLPWLRHRTTPFLFPDLARLGLSLPAPVGVHGLAFYGEAVRRHLPGGWEVPTVAGSDLLNPAWPRPALKGSVQAKALRYYRQRLAWLLARHLPHSLSRPWRGSDDLRGDYFAHHVPERVRALLLAPEALLNGVTPPGRLAALVEEHLSGHRYHTEVIGSALVLESWREQAQRLLAQARHEVG